MNLQRHMHQTATYWAADPANTDIYGKPVYSAPVTFQCRWETKNELFQSKTGEEKTSKSKVISTQPMIVDGWLFLGTSAALDPTTVDDAWEIQGLGVFPDLHNLQELTVAFL